MAEIDSKMYSVDPHYLEHIGARIRQFAGRTAFSVVCEAVTPLLTESHEISGTDNIPADGPLVVVKNHPFHFDALTLGVLFSERPDVRWLAKSAPHTLAAPEDSVLLLKKSDGKADARDIETLKTHLTEGGSLLATPWGAIDQDTGNCTSAERAAQNAVRYTSFGNATLLPIHIDVEWSETASLPVRNVSISIEKPIKSDANGSTIKIQEAITDMYETYVLR